MRFDEYFNTHQGKKVAVCGIGVSNLPLIRILRSRGIEVEARDKKRVEELGADADELNALGVNLICGPDYLEGIDADYIYRSPGMRPDLPQFTEAIEKGSVLTSEMEAFFEMCPCKTIGITGSDGKTTTSSVIAKILERSGFKTWLGGNIGTPLLDRVPEMRPEDYAVIELSSFQLMTIRKSPDIAIVTNVTPNHLDMHRGMDEYTEAKRSIFAYQNADGRVILNFDNSVTKSFAASAKGTVWGFAKDPSAFDRSETAKLRKVYLRDGKIFVNADGKIEEMMPYSEIRLVGMHNVENLMAVIGALYGIATKEALIEVARTFAGVEHRIEPVRELDGIRYYNNSIASSPTRVIAGLHSFEEKVILIAGGYDKHIPFEPLAEEVPDHVKLLILLGATKDKIRAAVEDYKNECIQKGADPTEFPRILEVSTMREAVNTARQNATAGDVIILSPACAAFDMYKNFEERGNDFKNLVNALK